VTLKHYLQKVRSMPPNVLFKKAVGKVRRELEVLYHRQQDAWHSTYLKPDSLPCGRLHSYFRPVSIDFLRSHTSQIAALAQYYLDHRFDLLGSGWVQVKHGMHCRGLEGYHYDMGSQVQSDSEGNWLNGQINSANLAESERIWRLVDRGYIPIDWHLDFKSGYRWLETTWYRDIPYGHKLGVDVKVPWELARMQHLPQLAWAYALATEEQLNFASLPMYSREFRNQVLDFIANNPPRFGVNWHCTMDVGIRIANWLVAYDLFRAYGAEFDAEFEVEFSRSVYQHGCHIISNLEWYPELRSNHYLANIVGLLFVAAYLPRTPKIDVWLTFAVQELIAEVEYQFYPDGANFEASTSYHRLSAEMVVYGTALVLGLSPDKQVALKEYNHHLHKVRPKLKPAPLEFYSLAGCDRLVPFPSWYIERLEKMAEFTMHITKPNGHIPQIGDNDSGRFLKLQPIYHQMTVAQAKARYANLDGYTDLLDETIYWDEDFLDHRHIVATINGLFERDDLAAFTGAGWRETDLIRCLARGTALPSYLQLGQRPAAELVGIGTEEDWERLSAKFDSLPQAQGKQRQILEIPIPDGSQCKDLKLYAYPHFGVYLYRSHRLYLAVRCGAIGQKGNGGHAHNDQLSLELSVDGEDWIRDPGSYLYTPLPQRRNQYRSVKAHFATQIAQIQEQANLELGLFTLGDAADGECLYFGNGKFGGILELPCYKLACFISIENFFIRLVHLCLFPVDGEYQALVPTSYICNTNKSIKFSTGYGRRENGSY